jgi:hypothetical protein
MLVQILLIAGAILTGAITALKVIAPKTATKKDDELLAALERIKELEKALGLNK